MRGEVGSVTGERNENESKLKVQSEQRFISSLSINQIVMSPVDSKLWKDENAYYNAVGILNCCNFDNHCVREPPLKV